MANEQSRGGSPILRHDAPADSDDEVAYSDGDAIGAHLERTIGASESVFHELVSDRVHIDVHIVSATDERPYHVLVTSGMSARPMTLPPQMADEAAAWQYAELCICLPASWPLSQDDFADDRNYWPVRLLKMLARLPHEYGTWLGYGHTIPNGDPALPYAANTELCCALIVPPFLLGGEFYQLQLPDRVIHIFAIVPLYAAEMDAKLKRGTDALLEALDAIEGAAYGPLDITRPCAV